MKLPILAQYWPTCIIIDVLVIRYHNVIITMATSLTEVTITVSAFAVTGKTPPIV